MYLTLRVDLDYVPWDTPDAAEFGHGEPAEVLRLLHLAETMGVGFHFFASNRVLRAFPAEIEALATDRHALDWLCKHPNKFEDRYHQAETLFREFGRDIVGIALRSNWTAPLDRHLLPESIKFVCSNPGASAEGVTHFPTDIRSDRDAARAGVTVKTWAEGVKMHLRSVASLGRSAVISVRPQVLSKYDPKLAQIREILELGQAIGLSVCTLRDRLSKQ